MSDLMLDVDTAPANADGDGRRHRYTCICPRPVDKRKPCTNFTVEALCGYRRPPDFDGRGNEDKPICERCFELDQLEKW